MSARFVLENGRRGEIERTIRRLMAEEEGEKMRIRATHLKEMVNLCVKLVDYPLWKNISEELSLNIYFTQVEKCPSATSRSPILV